MIRFLLAVLLGLTGAVFAFGGARLALAGGSLYYLLSAPLLLLAAFFAVRRSPRAVACYALFFIATLAWSLVESGLTPWALLARLGVPCGFGLCFVLLRQRSARLLAGASAATLAAILVLLVLPDGPGLDGQERPVQQASDGTEADWRTFGGTPASTHFSKLQQITRANVGDLRVAWTYRTGSAQDGSFGNFEAVPIKIADTVYLCTGANVVHALDAETGKLKWRFDPKSDLTNVGNKICRGVAYYRVPDASGPCAERIIAATVDARMFALDARDGAICKGFGKDGFVDLRAGMGPYPVGYYFVTSAPAIAHGKAIVGGWVSDNETLGEPSGVVRAFDAVTGKFAWAWDLGRPDSHDEPAEGETYTRGTPNVWAPISVDETLGLVFMPTGNATPDYFGAHRSAASERFGSSVVAVDSATGALRWSFQTVHHDLWDYDVPAQPTLADLRVDGATVPALIQATKQGQVYVLDRRDGRPVFPVEERPVPQNGVPEERVSPTQPVSSLPSFTGPPLSEKRMWGLTSFDQLWCRIRFAESRHDGPFTLPGLQRSIEYPGLFGAMNWGGIGYDPARNMLLVNANHMASEHSLIPRAQADAMGLVPRARLEHGPRGFYAQAGTPYAATMKPFLSPLDVPCQQPPFGTMNAVDLSNGKLAWTRPLGTTRDAGPMGTHMPFAITMGTPSVGGPLVTQSGLTFIAATADRTLRAFDTETGRLLWQDVLPAAGNTNPMTYLSPASGRQFVVISAGGKRLLQTRPGDYVVAYALPAAQTRQ